MMTFTEFLSQLQQVFRNPNEVSCLTSVDGTELLDWVPYDPDEDRYWGTNED